MPTDEQTGSLDTCLGLETVYFSETAIFYILTMDFCLK